MNWRKADPLQSRNPDELTAYVDGELDPAARARVAERLEHDAAARAEVAGQERLARLWAAIPPAEPTEAAWAATLAGIEAKLAAAKDKPPPRGPLGPWLIRLGLTAASLAACWLLVAFWPAGRPEPVEPFPVVSAQDIEIQSMDDADAGALVVGSPPVPGPLVLAGAGDITVERLVPSRGAPMPIQVGMADGPDAPMLWAPLEP
jgi:anti-sigma factor RsiW